MKKSAYPKHVVGIDEVGRGPLAGPVAVGAVLIYKEHYKKLQELFPIVRDSKKLTSKSRDEWFSRILDAESEGLLVSSVNFISSQEIDKNGISWSIKKALEKSLKNVAGLFEYEMVEVLLDGGLRAPKEYQNQKTIIKGDEKELSIALASIVAKVTRDRKMINLGKKFPMYGFERHKGYGTRAHYEAIGAYGISKHHRKSYLKKYPSS